MGKDRQEKKLQKSGRVQQSDRDQALHYPGATKLAGPDEARSLNDGKYS
ncbi:YpzI family protein [Cytobacillus sp. FJAT-54145]|uniref:YpzI family protein n=1 Tax=Cytobacillus spartinae TaxID=3299023 RepID=A0ABW6KIY1_9BACI